jgi:hypothetical protein
LGVHIMTRLALILAAATSALAAGPAPSFVNWLKLEAMY